MAAAILRMSSALRRLWKSGVEITAAFRRAELCVTGDTQIEFLRACEAARKVRVLVHEVTGWEVGDGEARARTRRWGHTHIDELLELAETFEGEALVLVHRSMRHSRAEVEALVERHFTGALRGRVHVFGL